MPAGKKRNKIENKSDIKKDNHRGTYIRTRPRSGLPEQGMRLFR
jgi:hypothetical protein